jgi:transcriptional regulator of NAD metabolism
MKLNKAERMLKRLDKKVMRQLREDTSGSVYRTIQEQVADQKLKELERKINREGIY